MLPLKKVKENGGTKSNLFEVDESPIISEQENKVPN